MRWFRPREVTVTQGFIRALEGEELEEIDINPAEICSAIDRLHRPLLHAKFDKRKADLIELIKEFVLEFGFLGIAPQQLLAIYFQPQNLKLPDETVRFVSSYQRVGGMWPTVLEKIDAKGPGLLIKESCTIRSAAGIPTLQEDHQNSEDAPIGVSSIKVERLEDWWDHFHGFTDSARPKNYEYPTPGTPDFWKSYHEPVAEWLMWISALSKIARSLATDPQEMKLNEIAFLNDHAATGYHQLALRDGVSVPVFEAPSLISLMCKTMIDSVATKYKVSLCQECNIVFIPSRKGQSFCNRKCKSRHNVRQHRAKKG